MKTGTEGGRTYLKATPPRQVSAMLDLTVTAPRTLKDVWVETHGGDVHASDFDGGLEARSGGGRDRRGWRSRTREVRTAGGDVRVGTVGGPLRCSSGGGEIRVENAQAQRWILKPGAAKSWCVKSLGRCMRATGGGNIRIDRAASTVFGANGRGPYSGTAGRWGRDCGELRRRHSSGCTPTACAANRPAEPSGLRNVGGALHVVREFGKHFGAAYRGPSVRRFAAQHECW